MYNTVECRPLNGIAVLTYLNALMLQEAHLLQAATKLRAEHDSVSTVLATDVADKLAAPSSQQSCSRDPFELYCTPSVASMPGTSQASPFAGDAGVSNGLAAKLAETRTLVASLQTAVDFVQQLSDSLGLVTQLLASATLTDVQEAITFLIYCHKFQVCHTAR